MIPTRIILHHSLTKDSETVSWQAIRRYHIDTLHWDNIGYQCGIEQVNTEYEILIGRMLNQIGSHTKGHNSDSIGICFVGNFDIDPVPPEQWHKGVELVKSLMDIFSIDKSQVYGHRDFADKTCPGLFFNMDVFRNEL